MPSRDTWETPGFSQNEERSEGEDLGQRDFTGVFMGKSSQGQVYSLGLASLNNSSEH